jgi:hypothetical protein
MTLPPRPIFSKPVQAEPSQSKKNQEKWAWIPLDSLGFLRPNRDFSMGYKESKPKKFSTPGLGPVDPRRPEGLH